MPNLECKQTVEFKFANAQYVGNGLIKITGRKVPALRDYEDFFKRLNLGEVTLEWSVGAIMLSIASTDMRIVAMERNDYYDIIPEKRGTKSIEMGVRSKKNASHMESWLKKIVNTCFQ